MRRLGFKRERVVVYDGEVCLGELDSVGVKEDENFQFPNNEIRIQHISLKSERCHPLSVLRTISASSARCKLEPTSNPTSDQSQLINLHASCFYELKTAVVMVGNEEVHLVAMSSKLKKFPCFWCYSVPRGLYNACLGMLNLRCLAIVFDLDETLIVANTMKSFEDRIEALRGWIARETDPIRSSGMSGEMKRYIEDRALLKQYIENDSVVDGGKVYKAQQEEVHQLYDGLERVVRPIIRLPEKNIVLTRINPEVRDTSVLVRLRPAWEDLKSYLTAKGRKRFEVYVCTMAERDYALEMWRLLDPEAHLISSRQLLDRVVCVKSGARKSLVNVFQEGNCHPKMAMVIDDRLKVWEDKDQPRVHVVPAFTPYYAPQAEMANAVPVLCVARNVACNVRGGFFKEFDENLLQKISEVHYEDEVATLPSAPDVSNYLMSEDAVVASNGNPNAPFSEGINGPEVAKRLNLLDEKSLPSSAGHPLNNSVELKPENSQLPVESIPNVFGPASARAVPPSEKPSLLGVPFRRDNSFTDSDPDMKRRFPMVSRGQDARYRGSAEPPILSRLPGQQPAPPSLGGWLAEEDTNTGHPNGQSPGLLQESDAVKHDRQHGRQYSYSPGTSSSNATGLHMHVAQVKNEEWNSRQEGQRQNVLLANHFTGVVASQNQSSGNMSELQPESAKCNGLPSFSISVLQEIGRRCNSKVEFRPLVGTSEDLRFSFEVLFTGEKIGFGMGKTRKDAQQHAAENALRTLADKYISYSSSRSRAVDKESDKLSPLNENGFIWDVVNPGSDEQPAVQNGLPKQNTSEVGIPDDITHD
ncbi:hypothetical protein ACH5RR_004966 [Cinchona calisaya]|uniref:protein-serine/threonine phosphatase n=1 Tax=Cinchona calisaya TaxID=153742 RepID=A0ABD3AZ42_9GENT